MKPSTLSLAKTLNPNGCEFWIHNLISHLLLRVLMQQVTVVAHGSSRHIPNFISYLLASECLGMPVYTTCSYSNSARWQK